MVPETSVRDLQHDPVTQLLGEREGKMKGEVDVSTEYRSNAFNHTQSFTGKSKLVREGNQSSV